MDNFNWGVRRPSLSRLEGTEAGGEASSSSAMTSLSDVTPALPKREPRAGVGAEESSDDEMGSQISARSREEISGASSTNSTTSSSRNMYPPTSLDNLGGCHRASTPHSGKDVANYFHFVPF